MINTLRKKFILISVLTTTFVIFSVFFTINLLNYFNVISRSNELLEKVKSDNVVLAALIREGNDNGTKGLLAPDKTFYGGFFVAEVKENKNIKIYNDDEKVSNEYTARLVNDALNTWGESGFADNYRYTYVDNKSKTYIVFVDCERDLDLFYAFLRNSAFVAITIICAVSFSVAMLSRKVMEPMEENYKKQKQFITDASHELKTPLAIISSNADVLEMEVGNSKWLGNIHNQIDRLSNLINGLVTFSRVEERENIDITSFSLSELVEERIEEFCELANFNGKKIKANIQGNIDFKGEKQSILQVIDILLDNAIKYADENSDINVTLYQNKKNVQLFVSNNADNLQQGDLSKVFDRFYRLDESRNSKIKGYGIGLSLAKLIIDKHKSTISAYAPEDNMFVVEVKFNI